MNNHPHKNRRAAPRVEIYRDFLIERMDDALDIISWGDSLGNWKYVCEAIVRRMDDAETTYNLIDSMADENRQEVS